MCTRGVLLGRAAPCTCRSRSQSNVKRRHPVGWRVGSGCGGRRESVHGGSVAPSMALTPPQPDPPRLRQFSAICWNGSWGQIRFPAENGSDPRFISISDRCVDQGRHLPTAAEICQRWGGVGWQDRWRHGWRHRAPMGEGALLAKHCFASARTPSRQRLGRPGGLRRVLPPHTAPPSHGEPAFDVAVAGQRPALPQVQGCKPCRNPPRP